MDRRPPESGVNSLPAKRMRLIRWVISRDNQGKAAEIIGLSNTELNQYEQGRRFPSKAALFKLERLCGITQGYLRDGATAGLTGPFGRAIALREGAKDFPAPLRPRQSHSPGGTKRKARKADEK